MYLLKSLCGKVFFKCANPGLFSFIFGLFNQVMEFLQQCKKYPSSIRRNDSNTQPLHDESSALATRPVANLINILRS